MHFMGSPANQSSHHGQKSIVGSKDEIMIGEAADDDDAIENCLHSVHHSIDRKIRFN